MDKKVNASRMTFTKKGLAAGLLCLSAMLWQCCDKASTDYGAWMEKPQSEWPQITMINQIEYTDKSHHEVGFIQGNPEALEDVSEE